MLISHSDFEFVEDLRLVLLDYGIFCDISSDDADGFRLDVQDYSQFERAFELIYTDLGFLLKIISDENRNELISIRQPSLDIPTRILSSKWYWYLLGAASLVLAVSLILGYT